MTVSKNKNEVKGDIPVIEIIKEEPVEEKKVISINSSNKEI